MPRTPSSRRRTGTPSTGPYQQTRTARRYRSGKKKTLALAPHSFVERVQDTDVITVGSSGQAVGLFRSFNLLDVYNTAQYQQIFEYYKIVKVVATFRYMGEEVGPTVFNTDGVQQRLGELRPTIYFQIDHDDVNATPLADLKASARTKTVMLSASRPEFSISFKPAILNELYRGSISTEYTPVWNTYLSTERGSDIPHRGLKAYAIGNGNAMSGQGQIHVSYKIYFTCKNNN